MVGLLLWGLCLATTIMSNRFAWDSPFSRSPIRTFVCLMLAMFVLHLIGLRIAIRLKAYPDIGKWIFWLGIGFRLVLLPSHPIQEIDIYRYMWDGRVIVEGENPYHYSPRDVLASSVQTEDSSLNALVTLRNRSATTQTVLSRIHFEHLTTIYPPVSQFVFAAAAKAVPESASLWTQRFVTKLFIVLFDVLTMLALMRLLQQMRKPAGWLVCYAWSPLVLKEFSNSGHLDSIAIGLTAWAIVWWIEALRFKSAWRLLLAAATLGLAVGAKLYPIVLVPVIVISLIKHVGLRQLGAATVVFGTVTIACLRPMLTAKPVVVQSELQSVAWTESPDAYLANAGTPLALSPALPDDYAEATQSDQLVFDISPPNPLTDNTLPDKPTGAGLSTFMGTWQMNDLLFMIVHENLKPDSNAWFSVISDKAKRSLIQPVRERLHRSESQTAFLVARGATASMHLMIVVCLMMKAWQASVPQLLNLAFLSVAWFWLLLPTLNPWYLIWAMPLLPFARLRCWLMLSGCVFAYYLRFWLERSFSSQCIVGTNYCGADFFAYVVVWCEFLPFGVLLILETARKRT